MLAGGGLLMALQFGSPYVALPWIGHHLGVAYVAIALLVPLVEAGYVVSQLALAASLGRIAVPKRAVIGSCLLLAALFGLILVAETSTPAIAAIALLVFAVAFGLLFGVFNLNDRNVVASTVPRTVRGRVLARRATLGGVLTLSVTFVIWAAVPQVAGNHLILVWVAVGGWIGAAAAYRGILELPAKPRGAAKRPGLRQSWALASRHPWFRRFLILRGLLLSVEMAMPFYAIHAASLHDPTAQHLSAFVVALSLGLVLSGPIWGRLIDRDNRAALVAVGVLAAAAGVFVLVMDAVGEPTLPFYHAALFLPLALAVEGARDARTRLILTRASADERPALVGLSSASLALAGIGVALVLGMAGHLHDIRTPLMILILLNVAAAVYAPRACAD